MKVYQFLILFACLLAAKTTWFPRTAFAPSSFNETSRIPANSKDLYTTIKQKFESSAFCDPSKVLNDPQERGSAALARMAIDDLSFMIVNESSTGVSSKLLKLHYFGENYEVDTSLIYEVEDMINSLKSETSYSENYQFITKKARSLLLQNVLKSSMADPNYMKDAIAEKLLRDGIFSLDDNENMSCPFIDKDVFNLAVKGREAVLKGHPKGLTKTNQLTVIDYTKPSNQRRMFVFDLTPGKERVIHNTWVAHGRGGDGAPGVDGLGGTDSSNMSNKSGENKSSDGFIMARNASHGGEWGDNVILDGIDSANGNMASRAVVLHGWDSPYGTYNDGLKIEDIGSKVFRPEDEIVLPFLNQDIRNASLDELFDVYQNFSKTLATYPYLFATNGCLGVPTMKARQVDEKHRNKTQLQMLREDLPGSLIFSYSGPDMISKFFK